MTPPAAANQPAASPLRGLFLSASASPSVARSLVLPSFLAAASLHASCLGSVALPVLRCIFSFPINPSPPPFLSFSTESTIHYYYYYYDYYNYLLRSSHLPVGCV